MLEHYFFVNWWLQDVADTRDGVNTAFFQEQGTFRAAIWASASATRGEFEFLNCLIHLEMDSLPHSGFTQRRKLSQ